MRKAGDRVDDGVSSISSQPVLRGSIIQYKKKGTLRCPLFFYKFLRLKKIYKRRLAGGWQPAAFRRFVVCVYPADRNSLGQREDTLRASEASPQIVVSVFIRFRFKNSRRLRFFFMAIIFLIIIKLFDDYHQVL
jgi:hypothetical protein